MLTEKGFLAICSEAKGLQGLAHDLSDEEMKIIPVPPGKVSTYSLDEFGKARLLEEKEFHTPGMEPKFTTTISNYSQYLQISIEQ